MPFFNSETASLSDYDLAGRVPSHRCLNCGHVMDLVILLNRARQHSTGYWQSRRTARHQFPCAIVSSQD
jgi:hypothetical protein